MIEARAVGIRIGRADLLTEVSLRVARGEVLALVGPNGAGKSTLLRVLSGDLPPTTGDVLLAERPLRAFPPEDLARARAVLPQEASLRFAFSALEVALMGRAPHAARSEGPDDLRIAREALRRVGLGAHEARIYTTLSGGERQRVQLARVLAQLPPTDTAGPRCLLLDEPIASQDLAHQHRVLRIAREEAERGAAVILVLHDLVLAAQYADRIGVLSRGHLVAEGSPADVLTPDLLRDVFSVVAQILKAPTAPGHPLVFVETDDI
ncbi:hemin ABC transporter, ATP-binding protein [Chondromyces apiculatus DSM 436]|uniref:Hemin ABC transporter, ATP-binding protein n=1 Tax=Chondromyces apiculatus DSM 436 TaxID=1192034 RepID=A0A017SY38_9BACT|nr:heme ABC transporter ATP-binding protein [Chondromyces apiculatus]EYF01672.1 hemin ABC transporter, ATP-binding protein [Chondromyces apiculatus DSM 436]